MTPGSGRQFGNPILKTRMLYFLSQDIQRSLCVHGELLPHTFRNISVQWRNVVLTV